jgi:hypothetical protein
MKAMGKSEGLLDMFKRTRLQILNIKHKAPLYEKASKPNPVKTPSQITPSLGLGFEQKTPPRQMSQSTRQTPKSILPKENIEFKKLDGNKSCLQFRASAPRNKNKNRPLDSDLGSELQRVDKHHFQNDLNQHVP